MKAKLIFKHQAGKHSQKTHGRRGGASSGGGFIGDVNDEDTIRNMMNERLTQLFMAGNLDDDTTADTAF